MSSNEGVSLKVAVDDWVGRILDEKYEIVRLLGHGGMGSVFEAVHLVLQRHVAIKILQPQEAQKPASVQRFIREGQVTSSINHPNVVDVQDFGREGATFYIVMELLKGDSLQSVLNYRGVLPADHAIAITLQILSALSVAHAKGIIHRDLKPDNVFLSASLRGEHVKIMDFGVAKYKTPNQADLRLTATGTVLGTPYYLAPEQASGGKNIDERIDLWSVGVMLYEMLTGGVPFKGDNYNEVVSNILLKEPVSLKSLNPEVPRDLVKIMEKALAKDKADRYESASAMMTELLSVSHQMEYFISTGVMRALQTSLSPPSPVGRVYDAFRETCDSGEETDGQNMMEIADSQPLPALRRPRFAVSLMIAAGIIVLLSMVIATSLRREETARLERSITITVPPAKVEAAPGRSSADEAGPEARDDLKESNTVTIDIQGIPEGAKTTLDGVASMPPLVIPRSDTPMTLKIRAPGFITVDRVVVPSKNQIIAVGMTKARSKPRNPKPRSEREKKTEDAKSWRANPFDN